ncbi:hypothetical protein ACSXCO_14935 (plasmid) [Clostridium perfringens]
MYYKGENEPYYAIKVGKGVKNNKARKYNTKKKKSTKSLQGIRIDKELYDRFQEKCTEFEFTEEKAIKLLIEE